MKVILIGNYAPDRQESMQRLARLFLEELQARRVAVELIQPKRVLGGFGLPHSGFGKWCGYIDKFVLFPRQLRHLISSFTSTNAELPVVHICDQANAVYIRHLTAVPHVVTCCDLLAIRCAQGEIPGQVTRWSGRWLQRMVLQGLKRAQRLACISEATRRDLLRLAQIDPARADVIPLGLNYPYRPMPKPEAERSIARALDKNQVTIPLQPFLLHVGGNQWYKNRLGTLEIYQALQQIMPDAPRLIMVGKPFTSEMERMVANANLSGKVHSVPSCTEEELRAFYSRAELLLFPSWEEGFGWPIIEAQACGCRVITTNKAPMNDVGGTAAARLSPQDPAAAARAVAALLAETGEAKENRLAAGWKNVARFSTTEMIEKYLRIYQDLAVVRAETGHQPGETESRQVNLTRTG